MTSQPGLTTEAQDEANEGVTLATTPFPASAFFAKNRIRLEDSFVRLYPHTGANDFSPLFAKGRTALYWLFLELGKKRPQRAKVILPAYGAQSLCYAAMAAHLEIELCDVTTEDFFFDLDMLNVLLGAGKHQKVRVVVAPYNWGILPCEKISAFHDILEFYGIPGVDDFATTQILTAQQISYFSERAVLSLFSFGGTKILSLLDGGLLTSHRDRLRQFDLSLKQPEGFTNKSLWNRHSLLRWRNYRLGQHRRLFGHCGNFDMADDMYPLNPAVPKQLLSRRWRAVLGYLLEHYVHLLKERRLANNERYNRLFAGVGIDTFAMLRELSTVGSRYPVLLPSKQLRDQMLRKLLSHKLWTSRGYIHAIPNVEVIRPYLSGRNREAKNFPGAFEMQDRLLTLPNHYLVQERDINLIETVLRSAMQGSLHHAQLESSASA